MQDIERNMDDLFRKAVENYQVKPGESNWDKIASRLSTNPAIPPALQEKNNLKNYLLILSFLLLFLFAGGLLTKHNEGKNKIHDLPNPSKTVINNLQKEQGNNDKANTISQKEIKEAVPEKYYSLKKDYPQANYNSLLIKKSKYDDLTTVISGARNTQSSLLIKDDANKKELILMTQYGSAVIIQKKSGAKEKEYKGDNSPQVVKPVLKHQGVYFGGAIGASLNSVKYQGFRKPGFDIGAIAGYQFNKKTAVETGLFFGKKYYFSSGKYFSMDKVGSSMPPQMKILSLEGSTTLFEIPLKLAYNVLGREKTVISASAGVSSYVLTKEKNNYLTSMNGTNETITGYYKNSSQYFAAAIDFSLACRYKLSNNKNVRMEPYVQIPLKGIGMGTLPVMSAGLRLGLTVFPH